MSFLNTLFRFVSYCFILLQVTVSSNNFTIPEFELNALQDLYTANNGLDWDWVGVFGVWNFSTSNPNPCAEQWQGIVCAVNQHNTSQNIVQSLSLSEYNLDGYLPNSIANLTQLSILDLSGNSMKRNIPTAIIQMDLLTSLDLSSNKFSGSVPSDTKNIILSYLDLSNNKLQQSSFPNITQLTQLTFLDLSENHIYGSIPSDIGGLTNLQTFIVSNVGLTGSIPDGLCSLTKLERLSILSNDLTGSLPHCIGNWSALVVFEVSYSNLNGTVPQSITGLTSIELFYLTDNQFSGTLPDSLGQLTTLTNLNWDQNHFTGTVPSSLSNLRMANTIALNDNVLVGSIPPELCQLSNLSILNLAANFLNGTLPVNLGGMSGMYYLNLEYNNFTGSIPDSLYNMSQLQLFSLYGSGLTGSISPLIGKLDKMMFWITHHNFMTGSIPFSAGQLKNMNTFSVSNNLHSGSLPSTLGNWTAMVSFQIENNLFTGSIPASFDNLKMLYNFWVYDNHLSGSLPSNFAHDWNSISECLMNNNAITGPFPAGFWYTHQIFKLYMNSNYLSGTIPNTFNQNYPNHVYNLQFFVMNNNLLSGTIPVSLASNMTGLVQLQLDSNLLEGSLPRSLSGLYQLDSLFVNNNQLTGNLDHVFNGAIQVKLINVDVSDNRFTGVVPSELFKIRGFQSLAAVSNCFDSASLPAEVCAASSLITLALDGLMAAYSCRATHHFFPSSVGVDSYWLGSGSAGAVPSCLFEIPRLSILHLSGNSFTSSLPGSLSIGQNLTDLSLSNNNMIGTVPSNVQSRVWTNLDLSFNKLGGTLNGVSFPPLGSNASLSLQVNRLSGEVPSALRDAQQIAILDGNLFGCGANRESLPVNDADFRNYECGSNTFNYSMYTWITMVMCFSVGMVVCLYFYRNSSPKHDPHQDGRQLSGGGDDAERETGLRWSSLTAIPSSRENGIVSDMLAWLSVFQSDVQLTPLASKKLLSRGISEPHVTSITGKQSIKQLGVFLTQYRLLCSVLTAFALVVMLPLNAILTFYFKTYTHEYAWILSSAYLSGVTPAVCILIVLVIVFMSFVAFGYFRVAAQSDGGVANEVDLTTVSEPGWSLTQYSTMAFLILLNVCLMVGVNIAYVFIHGNYSSNVVQIAQISVAAFKVVWNNFAVRGVLKLNKQFIAQNRTKYVEHNEDSSIDSHVSVAVLIMLFNNLAAPFLATALVSSNCFYNVITTPAAVEVSYLYSSCVNYDYTRLLGTYCLQYVYGSDPRETSYIPPFTYSYQCSSAFITNYSSVYVFMFILVSAVVPLIQSVLMSVHNRTAKNSYLHKHVTSMLPNILKPLESRTFSALDNTWEKTAMFSLMDIAFSSRLFDCDVFVVQLVNFLAVLMTFGVVFPPLAVVALVAIFSITYNAQLYIGRFVCLVTGSDASGLNASQRGEAMKSLKHDCSGARAMFLKSLWMTTPFVVLFYCFLLFDILGDAVGWKQAVWLPSSISILLVVVWTVFQVRIRLFGSSNVNVEFGGLDSSADDMTKSLLG